MVALVASLVGAALVGVAVNAYLNYAKKADEALQEDRASVPPDWMSLVSVALAVSSVATTLAYVVSLFSIAGIDAARAVFVVAFFGPMLLNVWALRRWRQTLCAESVRKVVAPPLSLALPCMHSLLRRWRCANGSESMRMRPTA